MGRPKKPARVLEINGAYKKNPQRRRARGKEPVARDPLGPPPEEWTGNPESPKNVHLLRIWHRIVDQDRVLNVLNFSHWMLVHATVLLQYKIDRALAGDGKATSGDYAQLKSNLAAMGMTPVDSAKAAEAVRIPDSGAGASRRSAGSGWGEFVG